jgi:hypothetical protein
MAVLRTIEHPSSRLGLVSDPPAANRRAKLIFEVGLHLCHRLGYSLAARRSIPYERHLTAL